MIALLPMVTMCILTSPVATPISDYVQADLVGWESSSNEWHWQAAARIRTTPGRTLTLTYDRLLDRRNMEYDSHCPRCALYVRRYSGQTYI